MPWPTWAFWRQTDDSKRDDKIPSSPPNTASLPPSKESPSLPTPTNSTTWNQNLNRTDWTHYTTPQTLFISALTTATTLALIRLYKSHLRRIPSAEYLKPAFFRHRSLHGFVSRVGDGDNFHLFHTPGGRWAGWGWAPGRRVQAWEGKRLKGRTLHVRLAGVDAPELAHFGRPEQPFARDAIEWLRAAVLGRWVRVYPFRQDQYGRVVCAVYRRRWGVWREDVGLAMLKRGLATVYEAKFGSEFGNKEAQYRAAEETAKGRGVGMWKDAEPGLMGRMLGRGKSLESPREYKTRMAKEEKERDGGK